MGCGLSLMIISRTPLRISFAGGGSDMASFYKYHQGAVVSSAINKYIYVAVNEKFDGKIHVSYSKNEIVDKVNQVKHELVRESLKLLNIRKGIGVVSASDILTTGTGLGSSSSYAVGLLNSLHAYLGKKISAEELAEKACLVEIEKAKRPIGKQDQYIASFGGIKYFAFNPDKSVKVEFLNIKSETKRKLQENLLLLYTGIARSSSSILKLQAEKINRQKKTRQSVCQMAEIAKEIKSALIKGQLDVFGKLLHENWLIKKQITEKISNHKIDRWYNLAREKGALGGKICGAGGGGFLLLYAPKVRHKKILNSLPGLKMMPFSFEEEGSKIVYAQ